MRRFAMAKMTVGQVALCGAGEAVGAVALEGLLDLVAGAHGADGGVAGVGHGFHLAMRRSRVGWPRTMAIIMALRRRVHFQAAGRRRTHGY